MKIRISLENMLDMTSTGFRIRFITRISIFLFIKCICDVYFCIKNPGEPYSYITFNFFFCFFFFCLLFIIKNEKNKPTFNLYIATGPRLQVDYYRRCSIQSIIILVYSKLQSIRSHSTILRCDLSAHRVFFFFFNIL